MNRRNYVVSLGVNDYRNACAVSIGVIPGQDYRTWTVRFINDTLSYLTKSS